MNRKLFTFVSALSLLLCLAMCGLWVRSYYVRDSLATCYGTNESFRWRFVESYGARVHVVRIRYMGVRRPFDTYPLRLASVPAPRGAPWDGGYRLGRWSVRGDFLGFAVGSGDHYDGGAFGNSFSFWSWPIEATAIPLWPPALAAAVAPAV
ncbi:MAG: hypothetical protein QOG34_2209, partial [Frankiaceae bacterium]|nr:hypothetical protein [Frankiaceae bacterium]